LPRTLEEASVATELSEETLDDPATGMDANLIAASYDRDPAHAWLRQIVV